MDHVYDDGGMCIRETPKGLFCEPGGFYIDPWAPVDRAIITHGHSDHARPGSARYLCTDDSVSILRTRLGHDILVDTLAYGDVRTIGDVRVSLHPAGHLLGSAQVRLEHCGHVTVVTGDYKTSPDSTCDRFELVPCHTFITECTFGLPIYRWPTEADVFTEINKWWQGNRDEEHTSVVFAYALGKAQRLLSGLDAGIGPILLHGAVARLTDVYRDAGVELPPATYADPDASRAARGIGLVIAPPSAAATPWLRRFGPVRTAFASGWMQIRGPRRRRAVDRGFVLSDHVDWPALNETIRSTGAQRIGVTHGYVDVMARWITEQGLEAWPLRTRFRGELDDAEVAAEAGS